MNIVRVNNIWNVHYIAGRITDFKVMDFYIVNQRMENPLLPEDLSPTSKEYIDIIIAECEGQRVALWVYLQPMERIKLRQFIMQIYEDARFEVV